MAQYNNPFTGVPVGWDDGEDGWGQPLNTTLLQYAFYHSRNINGVVETADDIPLSAANGSAYLVQENNRVYFASNLTWYFSVPPDGMKFRLVTDGSYYSKTSTGFVLDDEISEVAYSGDASDLTTGTLSVERTPAFTGEVTKPAGSATLTLSASGVTAGSYGVTDYTYPTVTIDAKGRITSAANKTIPDASTTVKGLMSSADKVKLDSVSENANANVNADWNSSSGDSQILNKPTLGNLSSVNATPVGLNLVQSTNPTASIVFPRINADNTVSLLNDVDMKAALNISGGGGEGSVTSVGLTVPLGFSTTNSPITSAGNIELTFATGYSLPTNDKQSEWDVAYTERNRWDGGSTGLDAELGRESLEVQKRTIVTNITATNYTLAAADNNGLIRFTSDSVKTVEILPNSEQVLPDNGQWNIRNVGTGDLTVVPETGVTVNSVGGSLVVPSGGTVTIVKVGTNEYDMIGAVAPSTTDSVAEGSINLYFTGLRAINSVLTGFVAATSDFVVSSTDTVKSALQKIQGRLNQLGTASDANAEDFATAAQGGKADTAIQLGTLNSRLGTTGNLGTAASQSVVESLIDITEGRIPIVGHMGIGSIEPEYVNMKEAVGNGIFTSSSGDPGAPLSYTQPYINITRGFGEYALQLYPGRLSSQGVYHQIKSGSGGWLPAAQMLDSNNTTVDGNGFIKSASPITKLYADRVENNDEAEDVILQKLSTGVYQLLTERRFATEGWYIETPKDANGNIKVFVTYEENTDGILVKTFAPDYSTGCPVKAGVPVDIPDGRWIDIRMTYTEDEIAARVAAENEHVEGGE